MYWVQKVSQSRLETHFFLIEQALWSDVLRSTALRWLEKYILTRSPAFVDLRRPARVRQDRADMVRAMLGSVSRGLERKQFSRAMLHNGLKALLGANVTDLHDDGQKLAFQQFADRHQGQQPPWSMVISPTKACNLRCNGCYASAEQGGEQLEWELFDRIITEAKTLWGMRFFTISGGEPFLYRSEGKGLLEAAIRHSDRLFMVYTNGTLIDESLAARIAEVGNLTPVISVEGFQARTDERRGPGAFQQILAAMANLRRACVLFGVSLTATRYNAEELLSDEFIDFFFAQQQAVYGWMFQYMPIGRGYTLDFLPRPEQRLWMWRRIWQIIRERKILLADFWNCGTVSLGCIAAGVYGGYFHIDWNGKVMPCVFVPYAAANIREIYRTGGTLDDILESPYFQAIRRWQWEYGLGKEQPAEHGNWLLPCSFRDHYGMARELIDCYRPESENEAAAEALSDPSYLEGMLAYDRSLHEQFDPVWKEEYLGGEICDGRTGPCARKRKLSELSVR